MCSTHVRENEARVREYMNKIERERERESEREKEESTHKAEK